MSAQYRLAFSVDYLITASLRYRQQTKGRYWFLGLKWFLASVLLALSVYCTIVAKVWQSLPFAVIASFLFLPWQIDKWRMRREFLESAYRDETIVFTVSEDGVHVTGHKSDDKFGWPAFTKARRFSDGLLLCRGPQVCWLPDIAGSSPEASMDALRIARTKVRDFRDVYHRAGAQLNFGEFQWRCR